MHCDVPKDLPRTVFPKITPATKVSPQSISHTSRPRPDRFTDISTGVSFAFGYGL